MQNFKSLTKPLLGEFRGGFLLLPLDNKVISQVWPEWEFDKREKPILTMEDMVPNEEINARVKHEEYAIYLLFIVLNILINTFCLNSL